MRSILPIFLVGTITIAIVDGAPAAAPEKPPNSSTPVPIEQRPYRIEVHLAIDPEARIDAAKRERILGEWRTLVDRFVGTPWDLKFRAGPSPLAGPGLETLTPESFAGPAADFDKIWVIRIGLDPESGGFRATGREFDAATRRLGAVQSATAASDSMLPRALLGFSIELFNPVAVITGQEGGRALLTVRGGAVPPASPIGAVVAPGTVFIPLRITTTREGEPLVLRIPYTYLKVESLTGAVARCEFVKAISDPLSKRWPRPYSFAAIGVKPGNGPLKLRFITIQDKMEVPAAGYVLTTREAPDGAPREVGVTDRSGRIVISAKFAKGLVLVRLLAGNAEPLFEAPMMAGESADERTITIRLLPAAVRLETQLDSLRDRIVDLVALRARLEARMKARLEGEDWDGIDEAIQEFRKLTPRETMAEQLKTLKEQAARRQAERKIPILTKTAQAMVDELQALIDRYLDDEGVAAYAEALTAGRAEAAEKAKVKTNTGSATRKTETPAGDQRNAALTPAPPPLPAPAPAASVAKPAAGTPAPNAPKAKPAPIAPAVPKGAVPF